MIECGTTSRMRDIYEAMLRHDYKAGSIYLHKFFNDGGEMLMKVDEKPSMESPAVCRVKGRLVECHGNKGDRSVMYMPEAVMSFSLEEMMFMTTEKNYEMYVLRSIVLGTAHDIYNDFV